MRQPPLLREAHRYPVVSGLAVAALTATIAWWCEWDVRSYLMSRRFWPREPWRLITSTLLHADIVHLAFNLYWLWVFGTLIEEVFGSLKTLGLVLLLAAGPAAAEYALLHGGVGLSGVGYGFFGLLWVLNRRDGRFFGAVDRDTRRLFVGWFFLCILLTVLDILPVANFAHGAGAVLGILLGHAISSRGPRRAVFATALIVLSVLMLAAAGPWRPYVNLQ
ncbi:MAG: rhomboid family intramembrane serine protease [Planctomycetota bacterium]